jgi:hypothetical protein
MSFHLNHKNVDLWKRTQLCAARQCESLTRRYNLTDTQSKASGLFSWGISWPKRVAGHLPPSIDEIAAPGHMSSWRTQGLQVINSTQVTGLY